MRTSIKSLLTRAQRKTLAIAATLCQTHSAFDDELVQHLPKIDGTHNQWKLGDDYIVVKISVPSRIDVVTHLKGGSP